ncbi:MAG: c-type cytochrome, partial [Planctomycetes bacterium]|nr:c-type cytochrome [Planctomycetota bacterium]
CSISDETIDRRLVWLRILELCFIADQEQVVAGRASLEPIIVAGWEMSRPIFHQMSVEGSERDYLRRAALLLAAFDSEKLPELVSRDLLLSESQEDQISGLMALRNHRFGWTAGNQELRLEVLAAMSQMVGGEGLPFFHAWLERETLATLTEEEQKHYAARKAALTSPESLPPVRPTIKKWKLDDLTSVVESAENGDAKSGSKLFRDALCTRCHRKGGRGPAIGPDLTFVSRRFSRKDILDSIINPSKSVAENYRNDTIETVDGRVLTGRPILGGDFRSETIRLATDPLQPEKIVEIDKKSIESHHQSDVSPMPQGLLDSFTADEIADILAFLTRGHE